MGYSVEVISRARARLAQARADKESENQEHLFQAYRRVPRLQEIDRQLRMTMAQAAQAVFQQGGNGEEILHQAKEKNLSLQQERQELVREHFEEGFLDDSPICDCCNGLGYVGSTMCECLLELCRQEQKKELTLLNVGGVSFDQFRLDYYPQRVDPEWGVSIRTIMEKTYKTCKSYAYGFSQKSGNLLFSGGTGLGKTFLSACIAKTVADNGYSVVYESASHLFQTLETARFESDANAREESKKYTACDLLIVDDLGTEMGSQFVTSALYTLVNDRMQKGRPTIISTNLTNTELEKKYSTQILSRLRGAYQRVPFVGDDIRVKKNWG